jgi:hypothetical protein
VFEVARHINADLWPHEETTDGCSSSAQPRDEGS